MQQQDRPEASQIVWLTPVDLHIEGQGHRILCGPCDALWYLVHEWSSIHGLYYERAKQSCIEALHHTRCAEEARRDVLSAVEHSADQTSH